MDIIKRCWWTLLIMEIVILVRDIINIRDVDIKDVDGYY